jgi:lipoprotein-anchoring transpeptidase ErfK/SrfK
MYKLSPYKLAAVICVTAVILLELGFIAWKSAPHQTSVSIKKSALNESSSVAAAPVAMQSESTPSNSRAASRSNRPLFPYIQIADSCGPYFDGACVNMRSGPGTEYPVVGKLRNGIVLKVATTTVVNGQIWYQIGFDGELHYPERVVGNWYVAADYVSPFLYPGPEITWAGPSATTTKRIVVDLASETLYAYDGDSLFMQQPVSTGLELTPTAIGKFWIRRKSPDSYMQGPIIGLSDQYYDLPGVPWDLYFTQDGAAIHGAYWHNHFGEPWSHGCVNLPPDKAELLYAWADLGTPVIVQN